MPVKIFSISHNVKVNNQITAEELQVIDDLGKNLGVLPRETALKSAQEKGLDLIEVSSFTKPPVARILDYDKYRYQQEKKERKQKAGQKSQEIKQIQISIREAKNDLAFKAKRANEFIGKGHLVEIMMVLRGREKANKDFAREKLNEFLQMLNEHKIVREAKLGGQGITTQIAKK